MRSIGGIALIGLLLVLSGCCGQPNLFVLLPDENGRTGRIAVSNQAGSQEIAAPYQMSEVGAADRAPAPPKPISEAEVRALFGPALAAQPRAAVRFLLYFEVGSTDLTAESAEQLEAIMSTAAERAPADISVVGHTDTMGLQEFNAELALRRAEEIGQLLVKRGLQRDQIEVDSHGENNLLIPTPDETPEPRNRRVEVRIR